MQDRLAARLAALREQLVSAELDGFIVGREDMYQGEEVPAGDERLAYISGFTGSAGFAFITNDSAVVFSDGRYSLQMRSQTNRAQWQCCTMPDTGLIDWLATYPLNDKRIGIDARLITMQGFDRFSDCVQSAGGVLCALDSNPVDAIWHDRPAMVPAAPWRMDDVVAGKTVSEKCAALSEALAKQGAKAVLLSRVDSVNWLVNMRGADLPCTPVNLCFALFHCDTGVVLLGDPQRLASMLGDNITVAPLAQLGDVLKTLSGEALMIEPASLPKALATILASSDVELREEDCPVTAMKARKNHAEIVGFRDAHLSDGVAMVAFLCWLDDITPSHYTESQIADILQEFRAKNTDFLVPSFATIAGAGPNGAIVHYRAIAGADRTLTTGDILLLDSGGHYRTGTTDITRTLLIGSKTAPPPVAHAFTHVLRGHIALAMAQFEAGATGQQLDGIARAPLWEAGLHFSHGTGHGVGHVLSVHEGPASISKRGGAAIEVGMVLSNEPGYYVADQFGIRIENLLTVRPALTDNFLCFETLTLCPFDRRLIVPALLMPSERDWLNAYHKEVSEKLAPHLSPACQSWLQKACAPI